MDRLDKITNKYSKMSIVYCNFKLNYRCKIEIRKFKGGNKLHYLFVKMCFIEHIFSYLILICVPAVPCSMVPLGNCNLFFYLFSAFKYFFIAFCYYEVQVNRVINGVSDFFSIYTLMHLNN